MDRIGIESRCIEIIDELVNEHHQWVTFEILVNILLHRFSVYKLEDLGIKHVEEIPTLHLVRELNIRLNSFLHMYSANRGIVTILDLDLDIYTIFSAFNYPSISDMKKKLESCVLDPNEIKIGPDNTNITCATKMKVSKFGIGELKNHPLLCSLFPMLKIADHDKLKSVGDVLTGVCEYMKHSNSIKSDKDTPTTLKNLDMIKFKAFLLEDMWKRAYDSLSQAGVDLRYIGSHEALVCNQYLSLSEELQICETTSTVVDTAVGIMRNKRLREDRGGPSSSTKMAAVDLGGPSPGPVDLRLENRIKGSQTNAFVDEIASEELKGFCFAKDWAIDSDSRSVLQEVGRWGEALVYHYLLSRSSASYSKVKWLNKDEESQAAYDILIEEPADEQNGASNQGHDRPRIRTTFIEVKTTRFPDRNACEISPNEWAFATAEPPLRYDLYRVYNAGDPGKVRITVVKDLYRQIQAQKVRLALVL